MSPFEYFRMPLTRQTASGGAYNNGEWKGQTFTNSTITASVQPIVGEELQSLPEARRAKKNYRLFTSVRLNTVTSQNPDRVIIGSETYEVYEVYPWQNNSNFTIVNHYEALVSKI
jgi:hypothetical protein